MLARCHSSIAQETAQRQRHVLLWKEQKRTRSFAAALTKKAEALWVGANHALYLLV